MKLNHPISLRLPADVHQRLEKCAAMMRIKKHTLAQESITAVVEAIERNDYRVVWPFECHFDSPGQPRVYPQYRDELITVEEKKGSYGSAPRLSRRSVKGREA